MRGFALGALALAAAGPAFGQAQAPAEPTCPAGGYAKPWYGAFGDNDGVLRAYEIASPCNGKAVRDAATAIGMGRFRPLGVKNVSTIRFQAKGQFADEKGRLGPAEMVDLSLNYVIPAGRFDVTRAGARPERTVGVFADKTAWNETAPGEGASAAPKALRLRAPLLKLTPFGALWSVIEAEGHATTATVSGATVITGASPYDGYKVAVTLDAKNRPVSARVEAEGDVYAATYDGWSDRWESPYLVIFPAHMAWTKNGKPFADLAVTAFHSNPYVVFPPPASIASR
jgi:hypothetical protein